MNDIQAQLEGNVEPINQTVSNSGSVWYAFVERARVAQSFFNLLSAFNAEGDVNWRVLIVDDLVSLCPLQEGRFHKASRKRRSRIIECDSEDVNAEYTLNAVTSKSSKFESESESQVCHLFPLNRKQYQFLYCLRNCTLPLEERFHNLGSKFLLRRYFDHCHTFWPGEPCHFPHSECAVITQSTA